MIFWRLVIAFFASFPDSLTHRRKPSVIRKALNCVAGWWWPTRIMRLQRERDNWESTAYQEMANTQFYRGLLVEIGQMLGPEVRTCDDGTVTPDVLILQVPVVVARRLGKPEMQNSRLVANPSC